MNENKLRMEAQRGKQAQDVLDNELVKDAFSKIENALNETWKRSDPNDTEGRERVYLSIKLLQRFKDQFEFAVRTGNIAEDELLRIKDPTAWQKMKEKLNG
ncbi:hypothetical protein GWO43_15980 [candidate division KSB1 bacterium]|nr:hypothetical protein [candidate division KSB1 bacterium]NIV68731.1 hypothetical protein [Phycisphaerae bacterium]NIS25450.1 hypothetical protein [candidate division KSB1 bacterium]NIT72342.1 hypothetical protein [candidate division KSB1 bacterium]NIU26127.1 hypothetical protein [candidate division KSB1 bacterium]